MPRRRRLGWLCAAVQSLLLVPALGRARDYPSRPIRLINGRLPRRRLGPPDLRRARRSPRANGRGRQSSGRHDAGRLRCAQPGAGGRLHPHGRQFDDHAAVAQERIPLRSTQGLHAHRAGCHVLDRVRGQSRRSTRGGNRRPGHRRRTAAARRACRPCRSASARSRSAPGPHSRPRR